MRSEGIAIGVTVSVLAINQGMQTQDLCVARTHMVDGMEFAAILKHQHLVRQVLCRCCAVVCCNLDLGPLGSVRFGYMEDFAPGFCTCPPDAAESGVA